MSTLNIREKFHLIQSSLSDFAYFYCIQYSISSGGFASLVNILKQMQSSFCCQSGKFSRCFFSQNLTKGYTWTNGPDLFFDVYTNLYKNGTC